MKKVLKWLSLSIACLIAIVVVGGYIIPQTWQISESITISAPADAVYDQIADLKKWQDWSPWTKAKDPTQNYTYEGPESGVGAKWLWTSEKMGKGWLEITKAEQESGITYTLFIDMNDMQSTIVGDIAYAPMDESLKVTWTDRGDSGNNLVKRWMSLFIKKMLGDELKAGLNKLKALAEVQS